MKREIKFRGLRVKYEKGWHDSAFKYGNLLNVDTIGEVGAHLDSYEYAEVKPETVGQYTGLEDKKGKEIYEGDIVTLPITIDHPSFKGCSYSNTDDKGVRTFKKILATGHCEVVYSDGEWLFKHKDMLKGFWIAKTDRDKFEVIGNIHENPELL